MENFDCFKKALNKAKNKGEIILLKRGESKEFAFDRFNLNVKHNTIKQFSEKLFFFGSKSNHFWVNKFGTPEFSYEINEISDEVFFFIFNCFKTLISNYEKKEGTKRYLRKNKAAELFFSKDNNCPFFISTINQLLPYEKLNARNYYLRILHQLGEQISTKPSLFVSSSKSEQVAKRFSNNGIIIYFWDFNFRNTCFLRQELPSFIGKPYKNQQEISLFTAIFPHYIYAFKYDNKLYLNPALQKKIDFENVALSGFEISQDDFRERLRTETNYQKGVSTDGITHWET